MITMLLAAISVMNIIMLLIWAFGGKANPNKTTYAKASLIWALIGIVFYIVILGLFLGPLASMNSLSPIGILHGLALRCIHSAG